MGASQTCLTQELPEHSAGIEAALRVAAIERMDAVE